MKASANKGFTLLETVIAMIILSTALVLLANSWSGSYARIRKTQRNFEIASLLERKMTEIDIKYKGKFAEIPDEDGGDFEETPDYSWKLVSKKLEFPDLASVMSSKEGGVDAMTQSLVKQLTDGLSKVIKEVKLTITFKHPTKNLEYSITTYFIDYNQDISFGMPGG